MSPGPKAVQRIVDQIDAGRLSSFDESVETGELFSRTAAAANSPDCKNVRRATVLRSRVLVCD
jgi:hypothetical protein